MLLTPASVVANTPNADVAAIAETDITVAAARAANFFIFIINCPFIFVYLQRFFATLCN